MSDVQSLDPLILDLVEWVAREPRLYSDLIDAWRTSCPRLTVWEDAIERGFVRREGVSLPSVTVHVTEEGQQFLKEHRRI
jgi:hypothetical protein